VFLVGALALAAIPPTTAGFSSKDFILAQAWQSGDTGKVFWAIGLAGAFITSVYIFRLVFMVFGGARGARGAAVDAPAAHGHAAGRNGMQAGAIMGVPLAILAVLCLAGGFLGLPAYLGGKPILLDFLHEILPVEIVGEPQASTEMMLQIVAEAASLLGIPVAWLIARRARTRAAAGALARPALVRFLETGFGFDRAYDTLFVRPFAWIARINSRDAVDRGVEGVGSFVMLLSRGLRWTQNGRVRWYAAGLAVGAVAIAAVVVVLL
jgi:NADH-quinone oxidoreductase subunit L